MLLQKELNKAYQKLLTDTGKITALFLQSSKKNEIKSLMVYEKKGELFINFFSRDSAYSNVKKLEIAPQVLDELFTPIHENMQVELVGSKSNYYNTFFILKISSEIYIYQIDSRLYFLKQSNKYIDIIKKFLSLIGCNFLSFIQEYID
jgi:hypothetical protein